MDYHSYQIASSSSSGNGLRHMNNFQKANMTIHQLFYNTMKKYLVAISDDVSWYWIYTDMIPQLILKKLLTTLYKTQGTHFCQFDPFRRNPDKVMIYFEDEEWTFRSGKTLSCDQSEKFLFQGCWAVFKQACKPFSLAGIQVSGDENKYNGLNLLMTIVCNIV